MILLFLLMSCMLSTMFIFLKHPLAMGCILLIQTILMSLTSGLYNFNFWFSYIFFLIMIGGMLILFIYMISVASNEKFHMSFNLTISMMVLMMSLFLTLFTLNDNLLLNLNFKNEDMLSQSIINHSNNLNLMKFFNSPNIITMMMVIIYLLITLIAVVKISSFKMGPLRQKF